MHLCTYYNGQNSEHYQNQMLAKIWSNTSSRSLLVGMQNNAATLEHSLEVSYKTKPTLTKDPAIILLGYLPKGTENLCPHKNLHRDVYSSHIHNCQNLETSKMSFNR